MVLIHLNKLKLFDMIKCFLLTLLILTDSGPLHNEYRNASGKNILSVLGKGELKPLEIVEGKEYYLFESEKDNTGSVVVFSSAKGRYDNFDYMVILKPSLEIVNIKILRYRSEYGYEIANKGWLKQFYNKPDGRFEYRKNIDALSGATYSAPSLVEDINLILDQLKSSR